MFSSLLIEKNYKKCAIKKKEFELLSSLTKQAVFRTLLGNPCFPSSKDKMYGFPSFQKPICWIRGLLADGRILIDCVDSKKVMLKSHLFCPQLLFGLSLNTSEKAAEQSATSSKRSTAHAQSAFRFHCVSSCFHQGGKRIFSGIVQEHWWKEGFSESCIFCHLFTNLQGNSLCTPKSKRMCWISVLGSLVFWTETTKSKLNFFLKSHSKADPIWTDGHNHTS